jgi:hypothetical protein
LAWLSAENPIEVMEHTCLRDGDLSIFVAYIGRDQLHADAQIESFLHIARQHGVCITVDYRPNVRSHTVYTGIRFLPDVAEWLAPQLAPFSPPLDAGVCPLPAGPCVEAQSEPPPNEE